MIEEPSKKDRLVLKRKVTSSDLLDSQDYPQTVALSSQE
jgi:hypothetical protein